MTLRVNCGSAVSDRTNSFPRVECVLAGTQRPNSLLFDAVVGETTTKLRVGEGRADKAGCCITQTVGASQTMDSPDVREVPFPGETKGPITKSMGSDKLTNTNALAYATVATRCDNRHNVWLRELLVSSFVLKVFFVNMRTT